jgi:hypothetical protein
MAEERPDAVDLAVWSEHGRVGSITGFLGGSIAHKLAQPANNTKQIRLAGRCYCKWLGAEILERHTLPCECPCICTLYK